MIRNCDYVVVATIHKVEPAERQSSHFKYRQKASATIEQCLKGNCSGEIEIFGKENFICAQHTFKPGRFLLFLRNNRDFITGANWQLGIRPISGEHVEWYADRKDPFKSAPALLVDVLSAVEKRIELEEALANNNAWKNLSYDETRFDAFMKKLELKESEFLELSEMGCLNRVQELLLNRPDATIHSILPLFTNAPIEKLHFFEGDITAETLSDVLDHLPRLQELSLDQVTCTDHFLTHIKSPNLRKLDIDFATVSANHIHALTNLTELCVLQLPQSFSNEYYVYLEPLNALTNLTLRGDHINMDAIRSVLHHPLDKLRIYGDIPDKLMDLIGQISTLRHVEISSHRFTDQGVEKLSNLSGLVRLDLYSRRITDQSVVHLNRLSCLTRLSLFGTNITDEGLSRLNLPGLKSISVRSTQVTEQGAADFKAAHPGVSISQ